MNNGGNAKMVILQAVIFGLAIILFLLSGIIAIGLLDHRNMWPAICLYWICVCIKYGIEIIVKVGI